MKFTWNKNNEASHYHRHHIHFSTAAFILQNDTEPLIFEDKYHSCTELRMIAIARHNDHYLWICYNEEPEDTFNIISARPATKREVQLYFERPFK